jgi:hypothetical protein
MTTQPKIFLSHTTGDKRDYHLAHQLAASLQERGAQVWIAPDSIPGGESWQEHIISGVLKECSHFLVILSSESIHSDWVLKEIDIAIQRRQQDASFKILPLKVSTRLSSFPGTDYLDNLQWVPYSDDFNTQVEAIAKAIGLRPVVYPPLPPTAATDFVGRDYVFYAVETFCATYPNGYFIVEGDPGAGKSAILAEFVRRTDCIAHFNIRGQGINTAVQFLESVCSQIIKRYGLPYASLPPETTRDGAFLSRLLNEASQQTAKDEQIIIAVDALDEVEWRVDSSSANILYLPPTLPDGVFFVMTRRQVDIPFTVHTPQDLYDLNQHHEETIRDVQTYVRLASERGNLKTWLTRWDMSVDVFAQAMVEKSEGNFMYLRYVLPEIENGRYGDLSIEDLPTGLEGYYRDHWIRMGMTAKPLPRIKIRIVYVLSEIRQPVSRNLITQFANSPDLKIDELMVQEVLDEWNQFLHEQDSEYGRVYSVYHASFRDFLHRQETTRAANVTINDINALIAEDMMNDLGLD